MRNRLIRFGGSLGVLALLVSACETTTKTATGPSPGNYKVGTPYKIDGTWYYPKEQPNYDETGIASWYGDKFHGRNTANGEIYDQYAMTAAHKTLPMPVKVRVTNLENGKQVELRVNDRGPFVKGRIIDVSAKAADLLGLKQKGTAMVRVEYLGRLDKETFVSAKPETPASQRQVYSAPVADVSAGELAPIAGAEPAPTRQPLPVVANSSQEGEVRTVAVEPNPEMFVQAAAFQYRDNAVRLKRQLEAEGHAASAVAIHPARIQNKDFYRVRIGPLTSIEYADLTLEKVLASGHAGARIVID